MTRGLYLALLVLFATVAFSVSAAAQSDQRVAVMLLLRPATLDDWKAAPAPNLHRLLENGAVALMNTRAARVSGDRSRESVSSAVLTLGAGARAACDPLDSAFTPSINEVSPGVKAWELFERRMEQQSASSDLVALNWPRVLNANRGVGYRVAPGRLGKTLKSVGAVIYATDSPYAPLVATDGDGVVAAIPIDFFFSLAPRVNTAVIMDAPADWPGADRLVGKAAQYAQRYGARLIILSPAVDDREYAAGYRLAPLVIAGPDIAPGLLTSRSTRTPGLIANTDVAGFVAGYFGATLTAADSTAEIDFKQPSYHHEADFAVRPAARALQILERLDRKAAIQRQGMKLLPVFAVMAGLLILAVTLLRLRNVPTPDILSLVLGAAIAAFVVSQSVTSFVFAAIILLSTVLSGARVVGASVALQGLCAVIWCAVVLHMLAPLGLLKFSLLGYSIVEGARYYGVGNEMMGALIGAVLVTAASAEKAGARSALLILVLATAGLVGAPQVGAKAGGVIVSVGTLLVYFGSLRGVRWNVGRAAIVVGAALMVVLAVALLDSHLNPGRQSHLGQAVMGLRQSGGSEWADIVTRKLAVEGRLLWRSAWALLLWGAIAGVLTSRRVVFTSASVQTRAIYQAGLAAIGLSVAFNDAGAVAGALCAALLWSYWSLKTTGSKDDPRSSFEPVST
ncbi:MAG: hypothetical protein ABIY70_19510 [Capsulimonas sp.]|uniref:hypothetical protein n=1 Tax=Capsulimonas sp. TaxID=2494211 RepID=UPI003266F523